MGVGVISKNLESDQNSSGLIYERKQKTMTQEELISILQTIPWFQEISPEHFEKLAGISSLIEVEAKHELFREGDPEGYLYVVITGRVAIEMMIPGRGRMRIYTAEPMDVVGWSSVTPVVRQRTAGAQVVMPSCLVRQDAAALRELCEEDHELGYIVMRRMANVVASRLLTTRLQLLDMFAHPASEDCTNV
jgi:CRP/FNR family cyclic AMP-dependent transcriptional regulator